MVFILLTLAGIVAFFLILGCIVGDKIIEREKTKWSVDRQIQEHIKLLHKPKTLRVNFELYLKNVQQANQGRFQLPLERKGVTMRKEYEVGDKLECTRSKDLTHYRITSIIPTKGGDVFVIQSVGAGLITKALRKSTILSEYRRCNG